MSIPAFDEIVEPNDQTEARRDHLDKLRELVGNVYPNKFTRSKVSGTEDTITNILKCPPIVGIVDEIKAVVVSLAERERPPAEMKDALNARLKDLGNVRISGRLTTPPRGNFVHLTDGMNKLQVYAKKGTFALVRNDAENSLDEENGWTAWQLLDHGDFIGVEGYLFITNTGELSVHVEKLQFLAKAMLPMPDKMHGIADAEIKQRQRYVDLIGSSLQIKAEPPASAGGQGLTTREVFERRAKIISSMRRFLDDHGYIEVETPMLTPKATGAAAKPFKTHHKALDIDLYARIAPELYLKRLLVGGFEKVYELNRNFRNEGISYKHNPEFTMLEFYCAYMDVEGMMNFCEEMLQESVQKATGGLMFSITKTDPRVLGPDSKYEVIVDFSSFPRISMEGAIVACIPSMMDWYFRHVRPRLARDVSNWLLTNIGKDSALWVHTAGNSKVLLEQFNWLASFDNLMNEVIELNEYDEPRDLPDDEALASIKAKLCEISSTYQSVSLASGEVVKNVVEIFDAHAEQVVGVESTEAGTVLRPTFIIDYPKSISPLSKASPENPNIAERFELFINGMEVANGFSELNDPREQYDRFVDQTAERDRGDEEAMVLDEDYIRALSYGMPPAAGIGIGIDRLVMLLTNKHSIRDVILFPHMRPEKNIHTTEDTESTEAE